MSVHRQAQAHRDRRPVHGCTHGAPARIPRTVKVVMAEIPLLPRSTQFATPSTLHHSRRHERGEQALADLVRRPHHAGSVTDERPKLTSDR